MPIRDAGVDKAAAEAGTTRLPGNDNPSTDAVLPPGDERNRQELQRAAEGDGHAGAPDAKAAAAVDKHQEAIEKLTARIDAMEADMLAKQNAAEDRADTADNVVAAATDWPADALDQDVRAKVAELAGVLPNQVFNFVPRTDGYRVYTNDSRKLDVELKGKK